MPRGRVSMRKVKEILRLRWAAGLGVRQIARSCNLSHSTVSDYLARGAVYGQLAGALYGEHEIPVEWRSIIRTPRTDRFVGRRIYQISERAHF